MPEIFEIRLEGKYYYHVLINLPHSLDDLLLKMLRLVEETYGKHPVIDPKFRQSQINLVALEEILIVPMVLVDFETAGASENFDLEIMKVRQL